jgi:hypothetical protein
MSTPSAVRAKWASDVFAHSTVTAITTKIYNYDIVELAAKSTAHDSKLLLAQVYNFIQYRVTKARAFGMTGKEIFTFQVFVQVYKEADINGVGFNAVEDAFETIAARVYSGLGQTWSGTVDYYNPQAAIPSIGLVTINDRAVWRGEYSFIGVKQSVL